MIPRRKRAVASGDPRWTLRVVRGAASGAGADVIWRRTARSLVSSRWRGQRCRRTAGEAHRDSTDSEPRGSGHPTCGAGIHERAREGGEVPRPDRGETVEVPVAEPALMTHALREPTWPSVRVNVELVAPGIGVPPVVHA